MTSRTARKAERSEALFPGAVCAGWDIGGSHLKLALCDREGKGLAAWQLPLPIWQGLEHLQTALEQAWRLLPGQKLTHALTLTAELSDIFPDRDTGVRCLLEHLERRFDRPKVYSLRGFLEAREARERPDQVASANWHATLGYAARSISSGVLLDIGGTTTDILPFADGEGLHQGEHDAQRMLSGELVYSGVIRTPVAAIAKRLPLNGGWAPVAAESFAHMADIYRLSGELPREADVLRTSDGADAGGKASARRLARLCGQDLGAGPRELEKWCRAAHYARELQLRQLHDALAGILSRPVLRGSGAVPLIAAGAGAFLVPRLAERCQGEARVLFPDRSTNTCASALAVAALAAREIETGN